MAQVARREYEPAEETVRVVRDDVTGSAFLLARTTTWLAAIVTTRGRLGDAGDYWETGATLEEESGMVVEAIRDLALGITGAALARGAGGPQALNALLERYPLDQLDPVERPYLDLAVAYAVTGDPAAARRLVDEFDRTAPDDHRRGLRYQYHSVLGEIALRDNAAPVWQDELNSGRLKWKKLSDSSQGEVSLFEITDFLLKQSS